MRRLALSLAMACCLTASVAGAQEVPFNHPAGTRVYTLRDSVQIVAAGKDTTFGVRIAGCDLFGYQIKYDARNDSTNIKVYIDISADNVNWVSWQAGAYDSALVSGTTDTERLRQLVSPPNYALFARNRTVGAQATGDTSKITIRWIIHWLPQALNAF